MTDRPLVSICVPTRNRADYLVDALADMRKQDWEPLEIIISDNQSDDDTEEVCRAAAAEDDRIVYVRQPEMLGLYDNHNFCVDHSSGEFVSFFHDDDFHDPSMIRTFVEFMLDHPDVGVVSSDWWLIGDDAEVFGHRDHDVPDVIEGLDYIDRTIRSCRSAIGIPGALIRREALGNLRWDDDGPIGFGDFAVWFRMAEQWNFGHIPERLWSYRIHRRSLSRRTMIDGAREFDQVVTEFCSEYLRRHPGEGRRVNGWLDARDNFIFWAMVYEVALARRPDRGGTETVVDFAGYELPEERISEAFDMMSAHRSGAVQSLVEKAVKIADSAHLMGPLAQATRHASRLRPLLGLD